MVVAASRPLAGEDAEEEEVGLDLRVVRVEVVDGSALTGPQ